jgi:uncharacterized SAM-binding protein YcdF (DUF218 family)
MLFFLKQLLKASVMPLPALLLLGFIGVYLIWADRRARLGRILVTAVLTLLLLSSLEPVVAVLGEGLERQHPVYSGEQVDFIVVLGAGHISDPDLPVTSWASPATLFRIVEGLRLALMNPEAVVLFSGYGGTDDISAAEVNRQVAIGLGLDSARILINAAARDTRDEARYVATRIQEHPFALVTSATHMSRAMKLFEAEGLNPIPAPAGYLVRRSERLAMEDLVPSETTLLVTRQLWYEALGRVWAKVRGPGDS